MLKQFISECKTFLNIAVPVKFEVVRTDFAEHPTWDAYWEFTRNKHFVFVTRHAERGLLEASAHELVHVACYEAGQHMNLMHCKMFQRKARALQYYLFRRGYEIGPIYIKSRDIIR